MAMRKRSITPGVRIDSPSMKMSPSSGASRPMMCLSRTLLPLPLGPMTTNISPRSTSKLIPLSTGVPSKLRRRPRTLTRTPFWVGAGARIGSSVEIHKETGHEIIQDKDQDDGINPRLGDRAADAPGAADGLKALV